ncbi:MAG: hypothetical protein IJW18_00205 [Lachnospiraceae bacterium]|nr:hypothetical protein [Lachnospiraceae bacterium]
MIVILTALRFEATPFIKHYSLKRDSSYKRNELYRNNDNSILLLVTRSGKLPSAISLTEFLTTYKLTPYDHLINVGICGTSATDNIGSVYLCNRILDHDTAKYYYPDMLYSHNFSEAGIETFSVPVNESMTTKESLVDMESSALFVAGSTFLSPHQMHFLKIPSDMLEPDKVSKNDVNTLILDSVPIVTEWIDHLVSLSNAETSAYGFPTSLFPEEQKLFDTISESLRLSVTMKEQLLQLFIYHKLIHGDLSDIDFCPPIGNVTNQKRKILFEDLRQQFLQ